MLPLAVVRGVADASIDRAMPFKLDVRKLKELGLTESPRRGESVLAHLRQRR